MFINNKFKFSLCLSIVVSSLSINQASYAQFKVRKDSLEKSTWYTAPRQIQIIDDAPIVKDYRTPPQGSQDNQYVDIPANPGGNSNTIPAGGMHFGNPNAAHVSSGPNLPRAGFGTNIPSGGIAHPGSLPNISHGGLLHPPNSAQPAAAPRNNYQAPVARPQSPVASSYGGYSSGSGNSYGASSNRSTEANVRGTLLRK